mgnify:FL=1
MCVFPSTWLNARYVPFSDLFPCLCNFHKQEQENTAQEDTGAKSGESKESPTGRLQRGIILQRHVTTRQELAALRTRNVEEGTRVHEPIATLEGARQVLVGVHDEHRLGDPPPPHRQAC